MEQEGSGMGRGDLEFWSPPSIDISSPSLEEALSVHESQLLKITCLSIILTAALRDSVFQAQAALQGLEQRGKKGCGWS